jgi:hypothetical protein
LNQPCTEGKLKDLIESAKAHIRLKVEQSFRVIKQDFSHQKTRLRGQAKSRCKITVQEGLSNLFLARRQVLTAGWGWGWGWCDRKPRFRLTYESDDLGNEPIE